MRYLFGLIMAGALLGSASVADAQFSISIGNPYGGYGTYGPGYYGGSGYGSGYGMANGYSGYSGYANYAYPGTTVYSSGYSGYTYPGVTSYYRAPVYSGGYSPAYGYAPSYGYGPAYGYRSRRMGIPIVGRLLGGLPF